MEGASNEINALLQRRRAAERLSEVGVPTPSERLDVSGFLKAQARHRAPPCRSLLREGRIAGAQEMYSRTWCTARTDQSVPETKLLKAQFERLQPFHLRLRVWQMMSDSSGWP